MTIKLELFTAPKDVAEANKKGRLWKLAEKEEVRFFLLASKLKKRCEELELDKIITFIRVAPTGHPGGGSIIRNSDSIAALVVIGIAVKVGKKKSVQDFAVDYWKNSLVAAPLDDRFEHSMKYVFDHLVEFVLERYRQKIEPVEPVIELRNLLDELGKKK